jgi:O-antigen ligase
MTIFNIVLKKTVGICLFFILAALPLFVNPTAMDYWYQPKIESVYGLLSIIIVAAIVRILVFKARFSAPKGGVGFFLFMYCCSAVISTILSIDPHLSLHGDIWRYEGLFTLLAYGALVLAFAGLVESRMQAEQLVKWLLVSTFLVALYGIIQYLGFNPTRHFIPELNLDSVIGSTIGNGNFFGKFLVLTAPLFAGYCLYVHEKKTWLMCCIALVIVLIALVLSMARASWLGCACAGVLFFCLIVRYGGAEQKRYVIGFGAVIAGALFVVGFFAASGMGSFNLGSGLAGKARSAFDLREGEGSASRLYIWRKAAPLILERPWFGYGPDTHEQVYKVFRVEYFKKYNLPGIIDRAHNNYIDLSIAQGLFGLIAYCGIVGSFLVWLWRSLKSERDNRLRMLYCAIFSGYVGYLVNDCFTFSVVSVSPTFWALIGLTISMQRLACVAHETSSCGRSASA